VTEREPDAIELIYNEYVADEKLKHGTKYERLAAIVFKTIMGEHKVVHDLRLSGPGKRTKHQIDVTVERHDGKRLRLIIECRHLFASSRRSTIDLDAVRSFASLVRDLQPDQGMMLTTVGYTKDARTFAEDEGVALGILREFRDEDWDGRVREVRVRGEMSVPAPPKIAWIPRDDTERERIRIALEKQEAEPKSTWTAVNYFYDENGNEIESLFELFDPYFRRIDREHPNVDTGRELFEDTRWVAIAGELVAVTGFEWELPDEEETFSEEFVIGVGDRVAKLVLQTIDGALDFVIFDRELMAFEVGPGGEIVPRRD
jgi:Restriction endonuclease